MTSGHCWIFGQLAARLFNLCAGKLCLYPLALLIPDGAFERSQHLLTDRDGRQQLYARRSYPPAKESMHSTVCSPL